jgi:hypothetical protein
MHTKITRFMLVSREITFSSYGLGAAAPVVGL